MTPQLDSGEGTLPEGLDKSKVSSAITSLLKLAKEKSEGGLFPEASTRILMDITSFKIPSGRNHFFNIVLPNSPYPKDIDILFVIPDDVKNSCEPEVTVALVKDRLDRSRIKVREVMTLKQLKDEYSTFEAKRQLAKRVDLILADMRIFKSLSGVLGREFYKKKKFPIALTLDPELENFNSKDFQYALRKTVLNISLQGTTSSVVAGHTQLSVEETTENISKISNWLLRKFPGGWKNVAKLSVYIPELPPLIIYLSNGTRNDVITAIGKGRKLPLPEEDELSTLPGYCVRVHATGKIEVKKQKIVDE